MTRITVTLENGADSSLLKRMIENMKGVLKATVSVSSEATTPYVEDKATEEWIEKMRRLSDSIDPSIIDMNDDKTRYLMSK